VNKLCNVGGGERGEKASQYLTTHWQRVQAIATRGCSEVADADLATTAKPGSNRVCGGGGQKVHQNAPLGNFLSQYSRSHRQRTCTSTTTTTNNRNNNEHTHT
jgi:hypothetical protein